MKKFIIFVLMTFLFIVGKSSAHVNHYKNIKSLEYELFLNGKFIGFHKFNFSKKGDLLVVKSIGNFKVKKLGIDLMNYQTTTEEIYKENQLIKFKSKTNQNDKIKFVNLEYNRKKSQFDIDGSSFKGKTEINSIIGSWWNHEIVTKSKQISAVSGRVLDQKVKFLGKKQIKIFNNEYNALHFLILSDDNKPLNKKKLNINVWYDSKTLLWIKSSYEKLGKWEYRLKTVVF